MLYDLKEVVVLATRPLWGALVLPGEKQYWLYLFATFAIAGCVYLRRSRHPSARGLVRFCLPWRIFAHRSALTDYKIWLINGAIILAITPAIIGVGVVAYIGALEGLRLASGVEALDLPIGFIAVSLATFTNLLALDLSLYSHPLREPSRPIVVGIS